MRSFVNYVKLLQPLWFIPATAGVVVAVVFLTLSDPLAQWALLLAGAGVSVWINGMVCKWAVHLGLGRKAFNRQEFQEAADECRKALESSRRFRDDDPRLAAILDMLGQVERGLGRYAAAELTAQEALAVSERAWGPEHLQAIVMAVNLGNVCLDLARYDEAVALYERGLAVLRRRYGDKHPNVAIGLNNLGKAFSDRDRFAEAEPFYREAYDILSARFKSTHRNLGFICNNLAYVLASLSKLDEAEEFALRAVTSGGAKPRQPLLHTTACGNLGLIRYRQGRFAEAEELLLEAYREQKQILSRRHPQLVNGLHYIAKVFLAQRRFAEAEEVGQRELHLCEEYHAANHPATARALENCAAVAAQLGRADEVQRLLQRAQRIRREHEPSGVERDARHGLHDKEKNHGFHGQHG